MSGTGTTNGYGPLQKERGSHRPSDEAARPHVEKWHELAIGKISIIEVLSETFVRQPIIDELRTNEKHATPRDYSLLAGVFLAASTCAFKAFFRSLPASDRGKSSE